MSEHRAYVERSSLGYYYWWCSVDDCEAEPGHYRSEQEAFDAARAHELVTP